MSVELWNDKTANLIDDYDEESEALRDIADVIKRDGAQAISTWALDRCDGRPMVRGKELVELALRGLVCQPLAKGTEDLGIE